MCSSTDIFVFFFLACITNRCDYPSWIMFMFMLVTVFIIFISILFFVLLSILRSPFLCLWLLNKWIDPSCLSDAHQTPSRSEFPHRLSKLLMSASVVEEWLSLKHLNSCWSVGDECCWAAKTMSKKMTPTHFVVAFFQRPNSAEIYMSFVENNMLNQHTDLIYRPQLDGV